MAENTQTPPEKTARRRRGPWIVLALVAAALAAAAVVSLRRTSPKDPRQAWQALAGGRPLSALNVVLVTVDTLRADHLSSYGHPRIETPHMDALAAEGVRFTNAATTVPFTLPAHSSIMTGTYPPYHGVRENVGYFLDDSVPTLAERLAAAGYATGGFVSAFVLDERWGIARGFGEYYDDFEVRSAKQVNMGSVQRDGRETIAEALRWLDEQAGRQREDRPVFLWLHLFDPHEPYTPPEPFKSRYPQHPYGAEVAYTDALVGEFRAALAERGLWEGSVIVLTADHGEGLGDHGESFHGFYVYDSTVRVPLVVRLPFGGLAGRTVTAAVSHVDLMPTILELVGQPVPETAQGESLLPLLLGLEDEGEGEERAVYSESYYPLYHYGWAPLTALRSQTLKYIDAPRPELYDLAADAGESNDLFRDKRRTAGELGQRLAALVAAVERPADEAPAQPDLDEETLRQLRALGYLAGRGEVAAAASGEPRADPKDKIEVHQSIMWAQSFISRGKEEAAEKRLREALAADPGMVDAHQMLGSLASGREDYEAAAAHFQRALELAPDHRASLFGLATAYRRLGRLDEALVGFRRLQALAPHDSKAAIAMTDVYVEQGRLDEALAAIEQATLAEDAPARLHNQYGELLALRGRTQEAKEKFRLASAANDRLAQPYFNLAVLAEEEGRPDDAVELYEAAIERAPAHFQAQFNLARLYGRRGELDRQQELYEAALESNPDFVRGYYFLAKLLMDRGGDLERAERLARDGLERDPDHRAGPLGYFVLADVLNRRGRRAEALRAAERGRAVQAAQARE